MSDSPKENHRETQREVQAAFARAAQRYDAVADFQRDAGRCLLDGLKSGLAPVRVADVGCGTGHGLHLLQQAFPTAQRIALDFALPMLARIDAAVGRVGANAQALPLRDASIDLYWSSLAMQWCDPVLFLAEAARVLRSGGRLAVSTLGPGTFAELRQAFADVDRYQHTIPFRDEPALRAALLAAGFKAIRIERVAMVRHHPDLRSLFRSIRDLGANRVINTAGDQSVQRRTGLMGKAAWQRFTAAYEALRSEAGLPLTYDTFFIYAEK